LSLFSFSFRKRNKIKIKNDRAQKIEFIPPKIISKKEEQSGQYGFCIKLPSQFEKASPKLSPQESKPCGGVKRE
jgi:hypothetical protein